MTEDAPPIVVEKLVHADVERVFDAWTQPAQLRRWWGPREVECVEAEVDLRIGGAYRLANRFDDGSILWISGVFEAIVRPHKLVYSWRIDDGESTRVTIELTARRQDTATHVRVIHEGVPDPTTREHHRQGWIGCLDGLASLLEG